MRVNFGVFAGRQATAAEIDELAPSSLPAVSHLSIVAEQRHEFAEAIEVSVNYVRIEVSRETLRSPTSGSTKLAERLLAIGERLGPRLRRRPQQRPDRRAATKRP